MQETSVARQMFQETSVSTQVHQGYRRRRGFVCKFTAPTLPYRLYSELSAIQRGSALVREGEFFFFDFCVVLGLPGLAAECAFPCSAFPCSAPRCLVAGSLRVQRSKTRIRCTKTRIRRTKHFPHQIISTMRPYLSSIVSRRRRHQLLQVKIQYANVSHER